MEYTIQPKPIIELVNLYLSGELDLTPGYQRNDVWTKNAQLMLIDSIKKNYPLPTFFLRELPNGKFEMVDGQQRTRALLKFFKTTDLNSSADDTVEFKDSLFNKYEVSISIITKLEEIEKIEEFYFRVNSSGLHLNRPEKIKSRYIETNLLKLSEKILNDPLFQDLDIFSTSSNRRMLDRDFVEELIALVYSEISDKKLMVDRIYEKDLTVLQAQDTENRVFEILKTINTLNDYYPINKTRYRDCKMNSV